MKILIVYGTTEGQTRKIARYMEDVLQQDGHRVAIADASDEPPAPDNYDAVLVGASIHMHGYQAPVTHYLRTHTGTLNNKPSAFFSVCMAVASKMEDEHKDAEKIMNDYLANNGWEPQVRTLVAGALKYTQYDFFKRLVMKMIARKEGHTGSTSQDYEFTDWDAVKAFVTEFAESAAKKVSA